MRTGPIEADPIDRHRFPADPWRLVELDPDVTDLGVTETLFAVANGYLGLRGNLEEGRAVHEHGTFINGFHETWPIHHAEAAYGFAKTGQTIVNVPDAKLLKLYVDDEPLVVGISDLITYRRVLDFRDGVLRRALIWRTPSGKEVKVESTRMVSMTQRHLALLTLEVTVLNGDAPIVISSQLINRQDGRDEYHAPGRADVAVADPRKAGKFAGRVLQPALSQAADGRLMLGYRVTNSRMTVAVAADHRVRTDNEYTLDYFSDADRARVAVRVDAREGRPVLVEKFVAYHSSRSLPVRELADRAERTVERVQTASVAQHHAQQRAWFDDYWAACDVEVGSDDPAADAIQQAVRYNLFTIAQASARADSIGVAAKGVTGSGYEGHYFWDSEIYVAPFLTYTQPVASRNLLTFRSGMLPAARERAREMSQSGALFPWRTINGEEASAYYAAGTAQVHIDADIAYATAQFIYATGDIDFLVRHGLALLVETARMWADLGFWRDNHHRSFHIHGVTGPDEYTTVVNNNLFTNVMARYNLEQAVRAVERVRSQFPEEYQRLAHRLDLREEEIIEWASCAVGMHIPFDEGLGIHPQDDFFLDREVWDLPNTPDSLRPLMLHYHPLVIYRFQVLKQADVVLALFLQGDRFTAEEKRADFEYYDPITTGDSTLSAVVQSVIAAEVGYHEVAYQYFLKALYVDLANLHANTVDGVHVASAGGVWTALVNGFGGMRDNGGRLGFDPRLPTSFESLTYRLTWHGSRVRVQLTRDALEFVHETGEQPVPVWVRGKEHVVAVGGSVRVPLDDQGPRIDGGLGSTPMVGGVRSDGTIITANLPEAANP